MGNSEIQPFVKHTGIAAPLLRIDIGTDAILPASEVRRAAGKGLGEALFANWRYCDHGTRQETPDFVLNREPFRHATILLAGANFGCGAAREQAARALKDFGFRAIIAPGFDAVFHGHCIDNGILPVTLLQGDVEGIAMHIEAVEHQTVTIDLPRQVVTDPACAEFEFEIEPTDKAMLLDDGLRSSRARP